MSDEEKSKSGAPIYRHEEPDENWTPPSYGDEGQEEAIVAHIEKYFGKVSNVFHEILSDIVHIDVHIIDPTPERNYYTLFTTGMSYLPMSAPEEYKHFAYAELMIHLPPDWDLQNQDNRYFWPIQWLKFLARFPHQYNTWLFYGHTVPTSENADPFDESTKLGCMLLSDTHMLDEDKVNEFVEIEFGDKTVYCWTLLPIYREEMEFKLDKGTDELLEKFAENEVSDIIDPNRKNTCAGYKPQ